MARARVWRPAARIQSAAKGLGERVADRVSTALTGHTVERRIRRRIWEQFQRDPARALESFFPIFGSGTGVAPFFGLQAALGDQLGEDLKDLRKFGSPSLKVFPLDFLQRLYWVLWHVEPVVRNVVQTWCSLIIGNNCQITIGEGQVRGDGADATEAWEAFTARSGYCLEGGIINQGVLDTLLIGERFHWFDPVPDEAELDALRRGANQITFPTELRVLDPISNGGIQDVKFDPDDPTQPVEYVRRARSGILDPIPAHAINHWKVPFGAVQARGRPFLEPATQDPFRLRQTVVTEWVLQIFRLQVMGLWYDREGPDAESLGSDVDLPPPLTIMEIPPGASLELPDLRKTVMGDRLDNTPDRMIIQRIAQAVQLPFHIVAQEFREANLASLTAAEGPLAKQAEWMIARFERLIERDVRMVVGHFQANGDPLIMVLVCGDVVTYRNRCHPNATANSP